MKIGGIDLPPGADAAHVRASLMCCDCPCAIRTHVLHLLISWALEITPTEMLCTVGNSEFRTAKYDSTTYYAIGALPLFTNNEFSASAKTSLTVFSSSAQIIFTCLRTSGSKYPDI